MKFVLFINLKILTKFWNFFHAQLSMKKVLNFWYFYFYDLVKFHAHLSWAWKKFYNPGAWCTGKRPAGLGGSVGCAVRLETRRSRVQPPPRSATFFRGDWSWNIFYGHSLPSADSRRAVVSFWRKNVHNTGEPLRGLSLPSKRVVR